jgi:hypothetical protein
MSYFLKSLSVVLLAAAGVSALTVPILPVTGAPDAQPAGCHQPGQRSPSRQPLNYVCCLAGHNSAIPQALFAPRPVFEEASVDFRGCLIQLAGLAVVEHLPFSSGDPPGVVPLRI